MCRGTACILSRGVGVPHERVHGAQPCPEGVRRFSVSLNGGESEESEEVEALRGLPHIRAFYTCQKMPF